MEQQEDADIDLSTPRFESILTAAVDRQAGEQRALQDALTGMQSAITQLRAQLEGASADTQALTQAILDLNAGLRENAQSMESRITSLATTLLDGLREMAATQQSALSALGSAVTSTSSSAREELRVGVAAIESRLTDVHDRLSESNDIAAYLRDQADDLDRILAALADVPRKLEGVIAQALRRALTVRAGLIREAEKALERTLSPVEERVGDLVKELGSVRKSAAAKGKEAGADAGGEDLRRLGLRQIELSTRLEDLHAALTSFMDAQDERGRHEDARDAPRATAPRARNAKPPAEEPKARPKAKPKAKAKAKAKTKGASTTPAKRGGRKAPEAEEPEPAKTKRTRRRNYIPV